MHTTIKMHKVLRKIQSIKGLKGEISAQSVVFRLGEELVDQIVCTINMHHSNSTSKFTVQKLILHQLTKKNHKGTF